MAFEFRRLWLWLFPKGEQASQDIDNEGLIEAKAVMDAVLPDGRMAGARCKRRGHPIYPGQREEDCFDCYLLDISEAEWARVAPEPDGAELVGALLCLKGAHRGETFPMALVPDVPMTIGADPDCDLVLSDPSISRRHLVVVRRNDRTILRDLGSLHHSAIRAEGEVQWQVLDPEREYWFRDGSHLMVGDIELLFRSTDDQGLRVFNAGHGNRRRAITSGGLS